MSPYFSLVVPVYKTEAYLRACVDSVLSQSFADFELLLVDDGSPDGCPALCDEYARLDPRVRVLHQPNAGAVAARRAGMSHIRGEYALIADSDDRLEPGALGRLAELTRKEAPDVVLFHYRRIDENGDPFGPAIKPAFPEGPVSRETVLTQMAGDESLNALWLKLIRADLFPAPEDGWMERYAKVRSGDDLLQSLPILARAERIYYCPEALYAYRLNRAGISWNFTPDQCLYLTIVRPLLLEQLRRRNLATEPVLRRYYRLYLARLWMLVNRMTRRSVSAAVRGQALALLWDCPAVFQARPYLGDTDLIFGRKLALRLFFAKMPLCLTAWLRVWRSFQRRVARRKG